MITICIVSYGSKKYIDKISQAFATTDHKFSLLIVENLITAESDWESYNKNTRDFNSRLIFPGVNLGFGPAINLMLAQVSTEYAVIINPDCLPNIPSIDIFISHLTSCRCTLVSGRLRKENGLVDSDKPYVTLPFSKTHLSSEREFSDIFRKSHFPGALFAVKVERLKEQGGYSKLFMYFDELDTTISIERNGGIIHLLDVEAGIHLRGISSGDDSARKSPFTAYCSTYSALQLTKKYFKYWLPLVCISRMIYAMQLLLQKNWRGSGLTFQALFCGLGLRKFKIPEVKLWEK